jgi:Trk K+ transport system NAD-binding subunit
VPEAEFTLQEGDHVTVLGNREGVREAMEFCNPKN